MIYRSVDFTPANFRSEGFTNSAHFALGRIKIYDCALHTTKNAQREGIEGIGLAS
jgi:hypothetical protein